MIDYDLLKAYHGYIFGRPTSETQYSIQSLLSGLSPIHNGLYSYRDNMAYMRDYMSNRGLDWSDVKYPYRTDGWSGGYSVGAGIRSVSRNIETLYGSGRPAYRPKRGYTDSMYG